MIWRSMIVLAVAYLIWSAAQSNPHAPKIFGGEGRSFYSSGGSSPGDKAGKKIVEAKEEADEKTEGFFSDLKTSTARIFSRGNSEPAKSKFTRETTGRGRPMSDPIFQKSIPERACISYPDICEQPATQDTITKR